MGKGAIRGVEGRRCSRRVVRRRLLLRGIRCSWVEVERCPLCSGRASLELLGGSCHCES